MSEKKIHIPTLTENESLLPTYTTEDAAGADVRANLNEPLVIAPNERALISTGLKVEIPKGFEIQVRPRSGLALKHGLTVLNTPGTIDADYRGDIGIILMNHSKDSFTVTPGMRIAQLIVAPVTQATFIVEKELSATARGSGGFGHTKTH